MEWITIDCDGFEVYAIDFLDGVIVDLVDLGEEEKPTLVHIKGWRIKLPTGDMDGPAFRKRTEPQKLFRTVIEEVGDD